MSRCLLQNVIRYLLLAMMLFVRATVLTVFIASIATTVTLRSPGDSTEVEGGRYFVRYHQLRYEITREQYEDNGKLMWRGRASGIAGVAMFVSLFSFIGIEATRFGGQHLTTRSRGPQPRVRLLKPRMASGRGPRH